MKAETEIDSAVRLAILETFLAGEVPTVASVSTRVSADADAVGRAFERLAAGRAIVLEPDTHTIRMAAPFAGGPTDHRVRVAGREHFANCVWDALGSPAMLASAGRHSDAEIETRCPDCGERLGLRVAAGEVDAEPPGVVAHFAVPAARWWADIVFT